MTNLLAAVQQIWMERPIQKHRQDLRIDPSQINQSELKSV